MYLNCSPWSQINIFLGEVDFQQAWFLTRLGYLQVFAYWKVFLFYENMDPFLILIKGKLKTKLILLKKKQTIHLIWS